MSDEDYSFLQSENPGKERLRAAREANELFHETYPRVADLAWKKELTEQIIGLILEQGKTRVEIPASLMVEFEDSWEIVTWINPITEGRVIELRGVPGYGEDTPV